MRVVFPSARLLGRASVAAVVVGGAVLVAPAVAHAAPAPFSFSYGPGGAAGVISPPEGYCAIDWTVVGGHGGAGTGGAAGAAGDEVRVRTAILSWSRYSVVAGAAGADGAQGGAGGQVVTVPSGHDGTGGSGGGGAYSAVYDGQARVVTAAGGAGGGPAGGAGGGPTSVAKNAVPTYNGPSSAVGDGTVSGVGVPCTAPGAPTRLSVSDLVGQEGSARLSFQPPVATDLTVAPVTGYEVTTDGGQSWAALDVARGQGGRLLGSAQIGGLLPGHEYRVAVRATGAGGAGTASATVLHTPVHLMAGPTGVTVTPGVASALVRWTPTGERGVVGYRVVFDEDGPEHELHDSVEGCQVDAGTTECVVRATPGASLHLAVHVVTDQPWRIGGQSEYVYSDTVPGPSAPADPPVAAALGGTPARSTLAVGQQVPLSGSGYLPMSAVQVVVYSTPQVLATVWTDENGAFSTTVTLPADLPVGAHSLVAGGVDPSGNPLFLRTDITVAAAAPAAVAAPAAAVSASSAPAAPAGRSLAYTGASVTLPALGGLAALVLGAALVIAGRRRRSLR